MFLAIKYSAYMNIAVAVSLVIAKAYSSAVPTAFLVCISTAATLSAFADKAARELREKEIAENAISTVLQSFLDELGRDRVGTWRLRLNLYIPQKERTLVSMFRLNMAGHPDEQLTWTEGQGYVGLCLSMGKPIVEDLSQFWGMSYREVLEAKRDSAICFGLSEEYWARLGGLGSVLCVPIPHPVNTWQAIGVLVLDSTKPLAVTGFGSKDVLGTWVHRNATCLSRLLWQAELASR